MPLKLLKTILPTSDEDYKGKYGKIETEFPIVLRQDQDKKSYPNPHIPNTSQKSSKYIVVKKHLQRLQSIVVSR